MDAAYHVIALPDHPNLALRLDEIERLERQDQLARNAAGPAARMSHERHLSLALQDFVIGRLHCGLRPGFQDRVLAVGDAHCRLDAIELTSDRPPLRTRSVEYRRPNC